jgi:glycosyltransferase involved in cell wall biosynthesis
VIVIADGCVDATVKEADEPGAIVADVPVNRGQRAALRLGYQIAREGGARYIVTTDADGRLPGTRPRLSMAWWRRRPGGFSRSRLPVS